MLEWWWTLLDAVEQFQLLRPWWLLGFPLLLGLPLLLSYLQRHSEWEAFIEPALLKPLLQPQQQTGFLTPVRLAGALLTLWLLALSGPSWREQPSPFTDDKAPLVIAFGLTDSMLADDLLPSRLQRARMKVASLLEARRGAPTALVAYSASAHVVLPLTEDIDILKLYLDELRPDVMPAKGANVQAALGTAGRLLAEQNVKGSIVLVADQVDTNAVNPLVASQSVSLLLVGPSAATEQELLQSSSGHLVDVEAVKAFTQRENIDWIAMTADDSDIAQLQRRIVKQFESQWQDEDKSLREDAGYYLVFPMALIMLLWFRRGMVLQWS